MYAHLENSIVTRCDCPIQYLSWMGKVPDCLPDDDGWKLNRVNYYQEGWLATGNSGGIVGVTFTAAHCKKNSEGPPRFNFNLRGHRSEVVLVKWNEPYQKLATCDATGVIFVWIKHEGRWSIELINDRNSQVTDFTWSHDGRMALICYRDGFVLVGSVAGQRYWSSMLNLDNGLITCGIWSHDDHKVLFGTTDGQIVIMNSSGVMLTQVTIQETIEILSMSWACEKFYLSEQDGNRPSVSAPSPESDKPSLMAISFRTGAIHLMSNYDDVCPKIIHTGLTGVRMEWSNDGEILAVGGFVRLPNLDCRNEIRFYNREGTLRYKLALPQQVKPVSHLTWGHNDRRLFAAIGCHIHTIWVTKKVASLQLLCSRCVHRNVRDETNILKLPLPAKIQSTIAAMSCPTIRGYIPDPMKLREFVCIPPSNGERLHCTMIRHGEECSGGHYTLYLEYLGGLIPLLKGKRNSKLRPEFIIFDPKIKSASNKTEDDSVFLSSDSSEQDSESDGDMAVEGCGSPRMQRRKKSRKLKDRFERRDSSALAGSRSIDELMYDDNLPECQKLVEVTSNIWGTKFKLHGLASFLPEDLGQVLYKTSLLHLQPRQMTVTMIEISPDLKPEERDPGYNANHFSESEDEHPQGDQTADASPGGGLSEHLIAISPETPACPYPIAAMASPQHVPGPAATCRQSLVTVQNTKADQLTPLEIRPLEGSPPQRRSPSFKPRSLSPSEQVPFASNTLLCGVDASQNCVKSKEVRTMNHKISLECTRTDFDPTNSSDNLIVEAELYQTMSACSVLQTVAQCPETSIPAASVGYIPRSSSAEETLAVAHQRLSLWANKASHQLRYIDDDSEDSRELPDNRETVHCNVREIGAREIMSSMQMLHQLEQQQQVASSSVSTGCGDLGSVGSTGSTSILAQIQALPNFEPHKKRLILSKPSDLKPRSKLKELTLSSLRSNARCLEVSRGDKCTPHTGNIESNRSRSASPTPSRRALHTNIIQNDARRGSIDLCHDLNAPRENPSNQSSSLPTSPVRKILSCNNKKLNKSKSSHRSRLQSPLNHRRQKYNRSVDSSDEEVAHSGDDVTTSENYRNLETFQKAQLNKKLRRARSKSDADNARPSPSHSPHTSPHGSPNQVRKRNFVMHNKAPMWNENSQVYQLDFGGRVTQESAKNFQIEFRSKQVMQFGRIDSNAYTMDFQYPFSAIQAFAVALANVTQRLK